MGEDRRVDLGFVRDRLPEGTHICQIYTDEAERTDALLQFVAAGLRAGERTAVFSEKVTEAEIGAFLATRGVSPADVHARGACVLRNPAEAYFHGGSFDPEAPLAQLAEFHRAALADGFAEARVIGEMTPEIERIRGGSRLLEYESRVSLLLRRHPLTAVCQYHARAFTGATLMDVLKVHPMMFVRGNVVHNPFYVPPEEILA